jgi:hypothetical protein
MSKYYETYNYYNKYLSNTSCCNSNEKGEKGPQGPEGFSSIGPVGPTGLLGISYTGPTGSGCPGYTGPAAAPNTSLTGYTGPAGPSKFWDPSGSNAIVYTGKVYVNGELDVSGGVITTTIPYGVRYNFYTTQLSASTVLVQSYLYQIVLCNAITNINITLPTGIQIGDWVIITNISKTGTVTINSIYTIPLAFSTSKPDSVRFSYSGVTNGWILGFY